MLYFSGGGPTIPWVNTKVWDETKDEQKATGWCPTVLDTNGDGKITKPWNEPVGGGRAQNEGGGGGQLGQVRSEARYARQRRQLRHHRQPDRQLGVDVGHELSGPVHPARRREESAGDVHGRDVHGSRRQGRTAFRAARDRRRSQRRHLGGAVGQRRVRQLRPAEVQGAQRPVGRRREALPEGLDVLPADQGPDR